MAEAVKAPERTVEINMVSRVKPENWIKPVTCVGTAGFEPTTP